MSQSIVRSLFVLGSSLSIAGCMSLASVPEQRQAIAIDGSSTVFPITKAIARQYRETQPDPVEVSVSYSGTGGGFKKFCAGEIEISNASRPISTAELAACDAAGIRFYELPIAFDALTVVVNRQNDWAEAIAISELQQLWEPGAQGEITRWNQIRSSWPDRPVELYGPGLDSGTYDYFTEVVVGEDPRSDFIASEDDELLAKSIGRDVNALGYFGLAYFDGHRDTLKALAIDSGSGPVPPTPENVMAARYQPLSRPLFLYVNFDAARHNPALREFVKFALENATHLVEQAGYIPLSEDSYYVAWVNYLEGETGTAFEGKPQPNLTLAEMLQRSKQF